MSMLATSSGSVTISEAGATPIIRATIASSTPTVTQQGSNQMEVSASTTVSIPFGNMTTATLVHFRFFDVGLGTPRNATVLINPDTVTLTHPDVTEYLAVSGTAAAGPTSLKITTGAGNSTRIEYELAGT